MAKTQRRTQKRAKYIPLSTMLRARFLAHHGSTQASIAKHLPDEFTTMQINTMIRCVDALVYELGDLLADSEIYRDMAGIRFDVSDPEQRRYFKEIITTVLAPYEIK